MKKTTSAPSRVAGARVAAKVHRLDTTDPLMRRAVVELDKICFPNDDPCKPDEGLWWVLRENGDVVGYAGMIEGKAHWYLCRIGVVPDRRGNGYSKKLLKAQIQHAKKNPKPMIVTDTHVHNIASANALIAAGFRLYEPEIRWSFANGLYWRLSLLG